jgi:hypothetical protein
MKLIHSDLNLRFDMNIIFMTNYSFSERYIPVDSDLFLVTNFVNIKIKPVQSFGGAHKDRVYVHIFIGVSAHMYISICVCTMFLKKESSD